jgi:di/tricarboxylate transporter
MVYGTGRVSIRDMLRAGLLVDVVGVILIATACAIIVPRLGLGG